jgi:hypothetical protein
MRWVSDISQKRWVGTAPGVTLVCLRESHWVTQRGWLWEVWEGSSLENKSERTSRGRARKLAAAMREAEKAAGYEGPREIVGDE